jgi:hypothetical protein
MVIMLTVRGLMILSPIEIRAVIIIVGGTITGLFLITALGISQKFKR